MIGLREDQQVGAQLAARIVTFLNTITVQCGRFYVAGQPCNGRFGWYSLWFFIRANATRASFRARITKA